MDQEIYDKYKKLGRGKWGKDFQLLKVMYNAVLTQNKDEEFTPFIEVALKIFLDARKNRMEGKPLLIHSFNMEPSLFNAMDIYYLMLELSISSIAAGHLNEPYIDLTDEMGYGDNPSICNAQRPIIGAYKKGAAPIPDFLVYPSTPCNSIATTFQAFAGLNNVPSFNIDMPYWSHEEGSKFYDSITVTYVIDQYKALISWLETNTKQKFDPEKFQKTMSIVNQARQNIWEFNELLKIVPCPADSRTGITNWGTMSQRSGTVDAVTVTKYLRDEAAENAKNGIGGIEDEKIRIAWPYTHIFHDPELFDWLAEEFHAVAIMDFLGYYQPLPHDVSTLENCFESLAIGALDANMVGGCRGPTEYYLDWVVNYVKDYQINCCIFPVHFACKHVFPITRITSEAVREETGVPSLIFGCDSYDSREVTSEMIRSKISDFLTQVVQ